MIGLASHDPAFLDLLALCPASSPGLTGGEGAVSRWEAALAGLEARVAALEGQRGGGRGRLGAVTVVGYEARHAEAVRRLFTEGRDAEAASNRAVAALVKGALAKDLADVPRAYGNPEGDSSGSGPLFWVAEEEGTGAAVGCVGLTVYEDKGGAAGGGERLGEVKRLSVAVGSRGGGVGARLMARAEEAALRLGCRALVATTLRAMEAACRFYEGQGFRLVEQKTFGKSRGAEGVLNVYRRDLSVGVRG
jgi:GNAT superfamily N-acetyltransferase